VSFAGGGTDIPAYYQKGEIGAVTNAAIGAHIYVTVGKHWDPKRIRLSYSKTEDVDEIDELHHELVKEAIEYTGSGTGIEISSIAQIPGKGTGLGSSSSYTVAILHALAAKLGLNPSPTWLAQGACTVELERLDHPGGKQDQFVAAYGGINYMTFNPQGLVTVTQINLSRDLLRQMTRRFPLYYTNLTRRSKRLLSQTAKHLSKERLRAEAKATVGLASQAREALIDGRLPDLGEIMHEGWERKRRINENATTEEIDEFYEKAIKAGAVGGKLCGAGGGGFFVFYVPEEKLEKVDKALGLRRIHVNYGVPGSQIVYRDHASF
jgi:D-glycero-alpha-D-manno-heptose-7-phosphate kinase